MNATAFFHDQNFRVQGRIDKFIMSTKANPNLFGSKILLNLLKSIMIESDSSLVFFSPFWISSSNTTTYDNQTSQVVPLSS